MKDFACVVRMGNHDADRTNFHVNKWKSTKLIVVTVPNSCSCRVNVACVQSFAGSLGLHVI
jgi:hypothetical protein